MRNFRLDDESGHQEALFSWAAYRTGLMPELQYMYHVPNGGKRDKATAAVLKRQGVKAGVPDIMLPAARAGYHGLYIELKAGENTTTKKQKEWLEYLRQQGYYEGIDIVTANMSLFGATWNLTKEDSENQIERYKALVYAKMQYYGDCTIYGKYDYCIIDNPPDIGLNVVNALAITDEVIVPVKVDEDALEGLDIVTEQIEDAKVFNPALKLAGVLITSYQNTDGEAAGVEWLEQKTDFNILGIIRYSKKVAENTFMRKPIYEYSPCCGAAQGYKKFVTAYTGKAR